MKREEERNFDRRRRLSWMRQKLQMLKETIVDWNSIRKRGNRKLEGKEISSIETEFQFELYVAFHSIELQNNSFHFCFIELRKQHCHNFPLCVRFFRPPFSPLHSFVFHVNNSFFIFLFFFLFYQFFCNSWKNEIRACQR